MASTESLHPTERAAQAARERVLRRKNSRRRAVWSLALVVIILLVASLVLSMGNSRSPVANDRQPEDSPAQHETASDSVEPADTTSGASNADTAATPQASVPRKVQTASEQSTVPDEAPPPAQIQIKALPQPAPDLPAEKEKPERRPAKNEAATGSKPPTNDALPKPVVKELPPPEARSRFEAAEFLTQSLPAVAAGAVASSRPVTLLEFPRTPEEFAMKVIGMEELASNSQEAPIELRASFSLDDQTLTVRDTSTNQELGRFFLQKRELRFRWKARATLSHLQQQFRSHCVLHVTWKGHPGRYYALHDVYVRSPRRVRDQEVRLRSSELPMRIDLENLYFGDGKLELADVYSHRFLSLPRSRRAEVPTLKRSRKDPSLFVDLDTTDGRLAFRFDARVNSEEEVKRRRKLFEHVDGNFYLHASLYRVVDKRIKVEVLRLGTP